MDQKANPETKARLPRHNRVRRTAKYRPQKAPMNYFDLNEIDYPGVEQRGKAGDVTCFMTEKTLFGFTFSILSRNAMRKSKRKGVN